MPLAFLVPEAPLYLPVPTRVADNTTLVAIGHNTIRYDRFCLNIGSP